MTTPGNTVTPERIAVWRSPLFGNEQCFIGYDADSAIAESVPTSAKTILVPLATLTEARELLEAASVAEHCTNCNDRGFYEVWDFIHDPEPHQCQCETLDNSMATWKRKYASFLERTK
jgi:hypothetical protein